MPESKADRFVAEATNMVVSDEFYEAYRAQVTSDRDQLRSVLADLAGEGEGHPMPPEVERAAGPLSKIGLERLLQEMSLKQRIDFARLVAGEWW